MFVLLKVTRGIYKALSGRMSPGLVMWAFSLGVLAAMVPLGLTEGSLYLILALLLFTRASIGVFLIPLAIFKPLMLLGLWRPVAQVGYLALEAEALRPFWQWLVNLPGIALLGLDRYAVMGGYLVAAVLAAALAYPALKGIRQFREHVIPRAEQYRLVRWLRGFWLYQVVRFVFVG